MYVSWEDLEEDFVKSALTDTRLLTVGFDAIIMVLCEPRLINVQ